MTEANNWTAVLHRLEARHAGTASRRRLLYAALVRKAVADAWLQLTISCALLLLFSWVFIWLMSQFKTGAWSAILSMVPDFFHRLVGVPLAELTTPIGRVSFLYVHLVTLLTCIGWALGRGSDVVAGGIAKGTLELVLTLPVRRATVLFIPAVVTSLGAVLLALFVWLGTWVGTRTVDLKQEVPLAVFWPGVVNLAALTFFLGGMATLLSSFDRDRWRPIWISAGLFIAAMIVKMVWRLWPAGAWLKYFSFLTPFEPQVLILTRDDRWTLTLQYSGALAGLGVLCYLAAAVVFTWRDIPVPR